MHRILVITSILVPLTAHSSTAWGAEPQPDPPGAQVLTLKRAYRLALNNNPTLEVMRARVSQADAEVRRAWAQFQPTARASGTYTYNDPEISFDPSEFAPPGTVDTGPIVIQQHHQFGFQVAASLPVFHGPAYPGLTIAETTRDAARLQLVRTRQDFLLRVADAYYRALSVSEMVTALVEKVAVDRRSLEVTQVRLSVGRAVHSEVARAKLVLVQDRQTLKAQRNLWAADRRRLAILVGFRGDVALRQPPAPPSPLASTTLMQTRAQDHRADLQALEHQVTAAQQAKRAAWWAFFPLLDLSLLYRWQQITGFAARNDSWQLVATLTFPLYEGGTRYADLRAARAQITERRAQRAELEREISATIVQLRAELVSAESAVVSTREALDLAKIAAEEMAARYEAGSVTQIDALDAYQRRLQAHIDLSRSRYTRDMARLSLSHAQGELDVVAAARRD